MHNILQIKTDYFLVGLYIYFLIKSSLGLVRPFFQKPIPEKYPTAALGTKIPSQTKKGAPHRETAPFLFITSNLNSILFLELLKQFADCVLE